MKGALEDYVMRGLLTTSLATAAAAGVTAGSGVVRPVRPQPDDAAPFYALVESDRRHDHPGLGMAIVAGETRLLINAGLAADTAAHDRSGTRPDALLITRPDRITPESLARVRTIRDAVDGAPLRIWGPPGTAAWVRKVAEAGDARGHRMRAVVTTEVTGGLVEVGDGVSIRVVHLAESHLAYLVRFDRRGLLVATDVESPSAFGALRDPIDLVVVRHTNEVMVAGLLESISAPRAVLAQDGVPATVRGIRESYRGAFEFAQGTVYRVAVPARPRMRQNAPQVSCVKRACP